MGSPFAFFELDAHEPPARLMSPLCPYGNSGQRTCERARADDEVCARIARDAHHSVAKNNQVPAAPRPMPSSAQASDRSSMRCTEVARFRSLWPLAALARQSV